jgi:molybdopterin converting factor subunit 1
MQGITVTVLFFGRLREIVGRGEDSFEIREGEAISRIYAHYGERWPELAAFRGSVVASRNREFAAWDTAVQANDEIAFLPPVSGG